MSATSVLPSVVIDINYSEVKDTIRDFLSNYKTSELDLDGDSDLDIDEASGNHKYLQMLQQIANRKITTMYIDLDDLLKYQQNFAMVSQGNGDLIYKIIQNTNTFVELFCSVIDELMPEPTEDIGFKHDVLDVILHQRKLKNTRLQEADDETYAHLRNDMNESNPENPVSENLFPAKLTRRYHLYFKPLTSKLKYLSVREIKGSQIGHYITVRGIVTRVSDVKPLVLVNAYTCDKCGYELFQEVYSKTFTPLKECNAPVCKADNNKGQLFMSTRASKFSSFQEVKLQELSNQVPIGHIPRSLTIHVNGDLVRSMNPGDTVDVSGIFMPAPYTGFRAIKAGLLTETYLETQYVKQHKKQYDPTSTSAQIDARVDTLIEEGDVYNKLAKSIAPEIYGHVDIKKVLLLLLCGGVTKEIGDGLKIRGDINVCLMGDPGVAKSQLLKAIGKIAPRSVYTTGRGSSGVGLTAAVMRDPVTDEMVLEGGALVLADNGICCIDEFDKMEETDRTAIHEVMEQQTISIAKAGITTTLNARTSILAAANPLYGRYNTRLSPHENINLPAALLSRFDIMFLILDQPSRENDEQLAQHVAYVHMHNKQPPMDFEPLDSSTIRAYINRAKSYRPTVPKEVGDYVVQSYINMRKESHRNEGSIKKFSHITPRTLLGILRLAQACARLRLDNLVSFEDVDEALRIIEVSKSSLYTDDDNLREDESPTSKIYQIIRNISLEDSAGKTIAIQDLKERILGKGFTIQQFDDCILEYDQIGVWQRVDGGESLMFIDNMEE